jgi:hypothetical protein
MTAECPGASPVPAHSRRSAQGPLCRCHRRRGVLTRPGGTVRCGDRRRRPDPVRGCVVATGCARWPPVGPGDLRVYVVGDLRGRDDGSEVGARDGSARTGAASEGEGAGPGGVTGPRVPCALRAAPGDRQGRPSLVSSRAGDCGEGHASQSSWDLPGNRILRLSELGLVVIAPVPSAYRRRAVGALGDGVLARGDPTRPSQSAPVRLDRQFRSLLVDVDDRLNPG